jgi:hypothetical protein
MLAISRKNSHFVFAVVQAGLTSLIAAGIASLPVVWPVSAALAPIVDYFLGNDIANRCVRCPSDSISFLFADERRLAWKR